MTRGLDSDALTPVEGTGGDAFNNIGGLPIEKNMASHMVKWGALASPALLAISYAIWSLRGLESSAYAVLLVLVNFFVTARALEYFGRISLSALMGAALGSFIFDLVLLTAAVIPLASAPWMNLWALGLTLIVTHLGLVVFEATTISSRTAYRGLRQTRQGAGF